MELEEAVKVIQKRLDRLMEEFKIEKEDFIDEPRIAYLMQEIRTSKTVLKYIKEESIPRAVLEGRLEEYKKILLNLNKFSDVDRIKAINERMLELQEILNKGE